MRNHHWRGSLCKSKAPTPSLSFRELQKLGEEMYRLDQERLRLLCPVRITDIQDPALIEG